jgi:hypothetical protein
MQIGRDRIVVPRNIYEAAQNATKNPDVTSSIKRTFEPLERDPAVTDFGLTPKMDDPVPTVVIPRVAFPALTAPQPEAKPDEERIQKKTARLFIRKAWLPQDKRNRDKHKWTFEWNGVPLSAPIKHEAFLDKLEKRDILIGTGDALDAEITFKQHYDAVLKVYIDDPNSFAVTRVIRHIPRS